MGVRLAALSEDQFFRALYYLAWLLVLLAAALPLARGGRRALRQAAVWVLIGGFVVALYLVIEWLAS
jgi:hypothetical protein